MPPKLFKKLDPNRQFPDKMMNHEIPNISEITKPKRDKNLTQCQEHNKENPDAI